MNNTTVIGQNIAEFRRQNQAKQEKLANYVGVSAQAVSKWENGGMPDADLLPKIADFLGTSVDALFGRKPMESGYLWRLLVEAISGENEMNRAFDICQLLIQAMQTDDASSEPEIIRLGEEGLTSQLISVQRNCGFAKIVVTKDVPYFLLIPDFSEKKAELFDIASLPALFADLGDTRFFEALIYLMYRESNKPFTPNLLTKKLNFTDAQTTAVIKKLLHYNLLSSITVEIDEEETIMYKVEMPQSFTAMIRFARELPQPEVESKGQVLTEASSMTQVIHN